MKYLHLDSNFSPNGKSLAFEAFTFNGGEPHIKIQSKLKSSDVVMITARPRCFSDMGMILLAADALQRMGVNHLELLLPYFPAARQDRVMVPGEPLSVKVYARLINAVGFSKVHVFDPHSEVTPALVDRIEVVNNHRFIKKCISRKKMVLIAPDGGALKKIYKLSAALGGLPVVECSKQRDVKTGQLKGFKVFADDLKNQTCLIVDDICDGGGTFLGLAKELKQKNAGDIQLAVSHGIFSKGLDIFQDTFSKVYTTDSFSTIQHPLLTQIKLTKELGLRNQA